MSITYVYSFYSRGLESWLPNIFPSPLPVTSETETWERISLKRTSGDDWSQTHGYLPTTGVNHGWRQISYLTLTKGESKENSNQYSCTFIVAMAAIPQKVDGKKGRNKSTIMFLQHLWSSHSPFLRIQVWVLRLLYPLINTFLLFSFTFVCVCVF